ncbi:MAG: hypothetical protein AB7E76_02805 [Deferribacterales bacterium]
MMTRGLADHAEDIPAGTIVAVNGTGTTIVYDPDGTAPTNVPTGVLLRDAAVDADVADILVHGCVFADVLLVEGSAADSAALIALETNTQIFVTRR